MTIQAKTFDNGARNPESTVVELNRIVTQAEELLKTLGEEGGAAVEAVRQRVLRTVSQAKVRLAGCRHSACAAPPMMRRGSPTVRARQSVEGDCLWRGRRRGRGVDRHRDLCAASDQRE